MSEYFFDKILFFACNINNGASFRELHPNFRRYNTNIVSKVIDKISTECFRQCKQTFVVDDHAGSSDANGR